MKHIYPILVIQDFLSTELSNQLYSWGAQGFEQIDQDQIKVYFASPEKQSLCLSELIKRNKKIINSYSIALESGAQQIEFESFKITSHLWICPYSTQKENAIQLKLGSAFGTGQHATTLLCASLLDQTPVQTTMMDLGCGSGILSLVAEKLGWQNITAVEILPEAIEIAQENLIINQSKAIELRMNIDLCPDHEYQCIVANMLAESIFFLSSKINQKLKMGGTLILSGLMKKDLAQAHQTFKTFEWTEELAKDGWYALCGKKIPETF